MSVAYDVRARATAARLLGPIAQGGKAQAVTLTHKSSGYEPATDTATPTAPTQTGSGVVLEYATFIRSGARNEPDSLIQRGDRQLLLSPLNSAGVPLTPPIAGDTVTLASGVGYTITAVAPLAPAGTVIYFECNIRGAG